MATPHSISGLEKQEIHTARPALIFVYREMACMSDPKVRGVQGSWDFVFEFTRKVCA